jgi:hypothetical protein
MMNCPKCNAEMVLGSMNGKRDRMQWVPPKERKRAELGAYPDAVMVGTMRPIGGSPVDAFCCPACYSIFIDGVNCKPNNK